tara:strand:+ start:132 stop:800 length:669 start_codon:yes stop_codon:yes gene_type:complete
MAYTQRIFTEAQCDGIYDLSQKVGSTEDSAKRFIFMSQANKEDEDQIAQATNFYNGFYDLVQNNDVYTNSVVPSNTSLPSVYTSTIKFGEAWGWHRDDFTQKEVEMTREWTVIVSLNGPEDYEGGEVVVLDGGTESILKMPKGYAAICPASNYVKFNKVTKGKRICMRWAVESLIKDREEFELNLRYNQLYNAFRENLSEQADELFVLANNKLLNHLIKKNS